MTAHATPHVTEGTTPLAVGVAFTRAWTSHDLATAATYVADDVVFDGPLSYATRVEAYMAGLAAFAQTVTGVQILAAFGDDEQGLIMYEVTTGPFGTLRCAEHFTVKDGKIQTDKLTFDTYTVRLAAARQAPAAAPAG
jgi:hypothetical protein